MKQKQRKKVLVLNPPSPDESYINRDQMGGMGQKIDFGRDVKARTLAKFKTKFIHLPVIQLVYAATILSKNHDVLVIDATNEDKTLDQIIKKISRFQPDFVFMAVSSSGVLYERDVVAKRIKIAASRAKIITIGDTISALPSLLEYPFDIGIIGEIEPVVEKIVKNQDLSKIQGIMYFRKNKLTINKYKKFLEKELDDLPFPKWELFNYRRFTYYPLLLKEPVAPVLSSRGCPFACHYCSYSQNMGVKWRSRSAENVVDEIEMNVNKYGFKGIAFRDPVFSFSRERTKKICDLIKQRKIKVIWACETRPELLNNELIDVMYSAGCRGINLGIESIHENELRNVGRMPLDRKKITDVVNYAEKKGIRITAFFILGLPGSTRKSIDELIKFSLELNPSHAEYKVATPFPGTKLYEKAKQNKWIVFENFEKFGGYSASMRISEELSPEYLEKTSSDSFKRFYIRRKYILRELFRKGLILKSKMFGRTLWRMMRNK